MLYFLKKFPDFIPVVVHLNFCTLSPYLFLFFASEQASLIPSIHPVQLNRSIIFVLSAGLLDMQHFFSSGVATLLAVPLVPPKTIVPECLFGSSANLVVHMYSLFAYSRK